MIHRQASWLKKGALQQSSIKLTPVSFLKLPKLLTTQRKLKLLPDVKVTLQIKIKTAKPTTF